VEKGLNPILSQLYMNRMLIKYWRKKRSSSWIDYKETKVRDDGTGTGQKECIHRPYQWE